jgi:hypothetical protein
LGNKSFEQPANNVDGNILVVPSNATMVTVDVIDGLFRQAHFIIFWRLAMQQQQQVFLILDN